MGLVSDARRPATRWVVAATLLLATSHFDRQVFAFLAPTLTRELSIDDGRFGLLAGIFSVAYVVAPPLGATLLDRFGLRRGLLAAVAVWSVVAALHGAATGFLSFAIARFALGLAEAPSAPGATRLVERAVPAERRARAIGFMLVGSSIGAVLAPVVSTAFASRFGWRLAFFGTALVGTAWIPYFLWATRGAGFAPSPTRLQTTTSLRLALADRAVRRGLVGVAACTPLAAFALLWGAKLLVSRYGVAENGVGKYLFLPPLVYDVAAITFGDLLTRFSSRRAERTLFGIAVLLTGGLAAITVAGSSPAVMTALACVSMAGVAGIVAINTSVLVLRAPPTLVTVALGIVTSMQALMSALASALTGQVVARSGVVAGFDRIVVGFSLWAALAGAAWVLAFKPASAPQTPLRE